LATLLCETAGNGVYAKRSGAVNNTIKAGLMSSFARAETLLAIPRQLIHHSIN
jgi:hypothetical protein